MTGKIVVNTVETYWECGEPGCCSGTHFDTTVTQGDVVREYSEDSYDALQEFLKEIHGLEVEIEYEYDDGEYYDEQEPDFDDRD